MRAKMSKAKCRIGFANKPVAFKKGEKRTDASPLSLKETV